MGSASHKVQGTGQFSRCLTLVSKLFDKDKPCGEPPCSFDGIHQPNLLGKDGPAQLVLNEYFYFTAKVRDGAKIVSPICCARNGLAHLA